MRCLFIKRRIYHIYILLVEFFRCKSESLAEALEVDYFALAQIADDVVYIGIVGKAQDIVVGNAGLLLAIRSPLTCILAADQGKPEAAVG